MCLFITLQSAAGVHVHWWPWPPWRLSETGCLGRMPSSCNHRPSVGVKCNAGTVLELMASTNQSVGNANARVPRGRKWNAQTEVNQAVSSLQQEVVGRTTRMGRGAKLPAQSSIDLLLRNRLGSVYLQSKNDNSIEADHRFLHQNREFKI